MAVGLGKAILRSFRNNCSPQSQRVEDVCFDRLVHQFEQIVLHVLAVNFLYEVIWLGGHWIGAPPSCATTVCMKLRHDQPRSATNWFRRNFGTPRPTDFP